MSRLNALKKIISAVMIDQHRSASAQYCNLLIFFVACRHSTGEKSGGGSSVLWLVFWLASPLESSTLVWRTCQAWSSSQLKIVSLFTGLCFSCHQRGSWGTSKVVENEFHDIKIVRCRSLVQGSWVCGVKSWLCQAGSWVLGKDLYIRSSSDLFVKWSPDCR